ncbi:MAG TPA: tRNA lysidine(34) synthetase TilS [Syntrophomonadaceae bacterium]|nr:tRNA lysidine(34) synthetase TilS [Syntrophomonadaceae bacterium]
MYQTVVTYIQGQNMIKPGGKIVVGVSGGADSMALLHILHRYCAENGGEMVAAHLNHGLRREALQDEQLVKETCSQWGITCYVRRVDVAAEAARTQKSWEEAGRDCRYQFFRELAYQVGADHIATAHHQNDQAETVLLHLLRGSGIRGLQGIKPVNGQLIRPLLCVTRQDIEGYVQENQLPFCQDLSNNDPAFTRNRIRLQLIPYLQEAFNPRIVQALNRLAIIAQEENAALDEIADQKWPLLTRSSQTELELDINLLVAEPPALQNRLILRAMQEVSGQRDWSQEDLLRVRSLLDKPGSDVVLEWGSTIQVGKVYDALVFTSEFSESPSFCYPVTIPGSVYVKELATTFSFEMRPAAEWQFSPEQVSLDLDRIKSPLFLRSRREGDRLRIKGLKGHKSLKKYFMEQKIPARRRNQIPLLAAGEEIYAVLGFLVTEPAAITDSTERILVIKAAQDVKTTEENCYTGKQAGL